MLVLTRKSGEQVLVGDQITIKVISVERGKVRIGIEAPPQINIRRGELTTHQVEPPDARHLSRICKESEKVLP